MLKLYPKRNCHIQNNTEQQNATENNTKSHRQCTAEGAEIDRIKEDIQQLKNK